MLTPDQIEKIAEILNNRISFFIGKSLGKDYLSTQQKDQLKRLGVNLEELYKLHKDPIFLNYQLGRMSQILTKYETGRYNLQRLMQAIRRGEYIKMSPRETASLRSIKMQSLADIRSFQGQIFTDINNVVNKSESKRLAQEKFIKKEIKSGLVSRKSYKEIAQDLGNKTGDWARNWNRIVQFVGQTAFEQGRADMIQEKHGDDSLVYKTVYEGACKHCIRLYLTRGIGSEPIIFKLSELRANGNNIGRKADDWKPVVGPVHPYCRCPLHYVDKDEKWNEEEKKFEVPIDTPITPRVKRSRVRMVLENGTEVLV